LVYLMKPTKLFFTTDIHGSDICFRKFVNSANFYDVDVIILSGDITGKMVVPIARENATGFYRTTYLETSYTLKNDAELQQLEKKISDSGYYPYCDDEDKIRSLSETQGGIDHLFKELMCARVERWIRYAEDKLARTSIKCFISLGNDDLPAIEPILDSSSFVINPEGKAVRIDDHHEMLTWGFSNVTPWHAPRESSEDELLRKIEDIASHVSEMKNCIFNLHCPPYDSGLDYAPALDSTLRVERRKPAIPAGSHAVRDAIQKNQPLLGLHGHIHESRGIAKIGRTLCINPGSEYSEGILRGVIVTLKNGRIERHFFTTG
jgi:Icc-related predicted phosphoesterase